MFNCTLLRTAVSRTVARRQYPIVYSRICPDASLPFPCNNGFYARFYATSEHINNTIFLKNVKSQSRVSHPCRILSYIPGSTFRWDHLLHRKRNISCYPANIWFIWDLMFLRRCWWRFQSSGIRLSVDQLESTDLSEKLTALLCLHIDSLR
jgi:hypothetical protein